MGFSEILRSQVKEIWGSILTHPFLEEMKEGTLSNEKYLYYIKQDYVYLREFSRCLGLAASKARDLETMNILVVLMQGCLTYEMRMLRDHLLELGLNEKEIVSIEMSPTNYAYTRHMLYVAYTGSLGENLSALLPCMWTYQLIGEKLWQEKSKDLHKYYHEWIREYQLEEYRQLVENYKKLMDIEGREAGNVEKSSMMSHFKMSSRYEYMFWEMAYKMEEWPHN